MEMCYAQRDLAEAAETICRMAREAGGRALLVGGGVRDAALGLGAKDLDFEVYGIEPGRLRRLIGARFPLDLVGHSFGVLKLRHLPVDISVPRRESKAGLGHRGFEVMADPSMTPVEAARRRDFTINAIAWDPLTGEVIDPFGGMADLEARRLRHVSDQFGEDPLRVLRGMQMAARFELEADPATVALCRSIGFEDLVPERVFEEWRKLLLLGRRPSLGLSFLRDTRWVRYFPELEALIECPQDPAWHPEGTVWIHTGHCLDAFAAERAGQDAEDLIVGLAILCHDLGKPAATRFEEGRIRSPGHEAAGEAPTRAFLGRMTRQRDLIEAVIPLVLAHLRPQELFDAQAGDSAVRRLARRVGRIDRLVRVARADQQGRPPRPFDGFPAGVWLIERATALNIRDSAPKPIVMGRHLEQLGLVPGPAFRPILDACYEAQLDGQFHTLEQGMALARRRIQEIESPGQ